MIEVWQKTEDKKKRRFIFFIFLHTWSSFLEHTPDYKARVVDLDQATCEWLFPVKSCCSPPGIWSPPPPHHLSFRPKSLEPVISPRKGTVFTWKYKKFPPRNKDFPPRYTAFSLLLQSVRFPPFCFRYFCSAWNPSCDVGIIAADH